VPSLARLLAGRHPVVAVVSQPDRPRGRGRKPSPSPVAETALAAGVPLLRPERVGDRDVAEALRAHAPDLGVVVAFGQFIPKHVRTLPRLGYLVNAHASVLPRHRGAAPIASAILAGDAETGISVMRVEREMDAGPVTLVCRTPIGPEETRGELEPRLAALAADALADALDAIAAGAATWVEQDAARATIAPKLARADGALDFTEGAETLARRVRALAPKPGAFAELAGEPLRLLGARAEAGTAHLPPGTLRVEGGVLRIATGSGWLVPTRLQRAGGRALDTAEYLRGNPIENGARLAPPPVLSDERTASAAEAT
jgi:methionyl-tRNA formyltransferase